MKARDVIQLAENQSITRLAPCQGPPTAPIASRRFPLKTCRRVAMSRPVREKFLSPPNGLPPPITESAGLTRARCERGCLRPATC